MYIDRFLGWLWGLFPDKCEVCLGEKGGVRGNENVIDGVVMCDYCHAAKDYE